MFGLIDDRDFINSKGKISVIPGVAALVHSPVLLVEEDEDSGRGLLLQPVDELLSTHDSAFLGGLGE